jgi:subtilisin family serine protease
MLSGGASASLDAAVAKAVATGIPVVVAAGNDNANACNYSPAREASAITVGATTNTDARASYSNFGSCLDLFAPGSAITSAWHESTGAVKTLNGTSMAAPHVAGLVALILGSSADATPADIPDLIRAVATAGVVTSAGTGSPNLLLYTLADSVAEAPASPALMASVAGLSSHASSLRNGWQATVTIAVKDANGVLVAGAKVSGGFTVGGSSVSCTTASNGLCSVKTGTLGKRVDQTTFSVSGIAGTGVTYDPSRNVTSSVTVRRP